MFTGSSRKRLLWVLTISIALEIQSIRSYQLDHKTDVKEQSNDVNSFENGDRMRPMPASNRLESARPRVPSVTVQRRFDPSQERLGSCDAKTVERLTAAHFEALEQGLRVFGCWTPRVRRLFSLLDREESEGATQTRAEDLSANQGYRLRCRILLQYDTCRAVFIRFEAEERPDVSTDWPQDVLDAINHRE